MSSTLERHAVAVGDLLVGEGPAVVITGRVSLRAHRGRADAYDVLRDRVTLAEPYSAADLPAIAELADAVVVGASWTRDIPLVRAAAGLGLPVVVERRAGASLEEWLGLADYCAAEGDGRVILCDGARGGHPDLGLMRAARLTSGRPVLADVSLDIGMSAAAVAAGADGLIVDGTNRAPATPGRVGTRPSTERRPGLVGGADLSRPARAPETPELPPSARAGQSPAATPDPAADTSERPADSPERSAETPILPAEIPGPEAPDSTVDALTALRLAEEAVTVVGALLRPESPATLPECREAIDRVDAALATLLERRAALAGAVQRLKPIGGFAGRDLARERALVARMALRAPSLGEARLAPIMNAVIEAGLHLAEERAAR